MNTYCSRCNENVAISESVCNECMWHIMIGVATFTVADIMAMFDEESYQMDLARGL